MFYILNIILPCIMLSILQLCVFLAPPPSGEKISLSITVLLSFTVFLLIVSESMPQTSLNVPLLGNYTHAITIRDHSHRRKRKRFRFFPLSAFVYVRPPDKFTENPIIFTLSCDKDQRKNSLSLSLGWNYLQSQMGLIRFLTKYSYCFERFRFCSVWMDLNTKQDFVHNLTKISVFLMARGFSSSTPNVK